MKNKLSYKKTQSYANTRKTGKEQYYTNSETADFCVKEVLKIISLKERKILEPAGGTGEFIEALIRNGVSEDSIISFDIEPKHRLVKLGDYLDQQIEGPVISISNPPFGRASSLAKKFFNHAANHSEYICYLIPKAWRKWSLINSLDENFHLIHDVDLPPNCFYDSDGMVSKKDVLQTVFQIWQKKEHKRKKIEVEDNNLIEKISPDSDGFIKDADIGLVVFGWSCGKVFQVSKKESPVTTSIYLKVKNPQVIEALKKIDFSVYFKNVASVYSLSLKEINFELNKYFNI